MTDAELKPRRSRHVSSSRNGCLISFLFLLILILIAGNVLMGAYEGLQDRVINTREEVDRHYQKALEYIDDNRLALAKAELELTLSIDPAHIAAREILAQIQATPSPETALFTTEDDTSLSNANTEPDVETTSRLNALFVDVKAETQQGQWAKAIEILKQIRDTNSNFRRKEISDILYNANYELGLRLVTEVRLNDAIDAFTEALFERPDDPIVNGERDKVLLYLSLNAPDPPNFDANIAVLNKIYAQDPHFADVDGLLYENYRRWGDFMGSQDNWCEAAARYEDAANFASTGQIKSLISDAEANCNKTRIAQASPTPTVSPTARRARPTPTPTPARRQASPTLTPTPVPKTTQTGVIYFSRFNAKDNLWEIIGVSLAAGTETVVKSNGIQPAVSPAGRLLAYQSTAGNSVGLHVFNLMTNEDVRATQFAEDVLPSWRRGEKDFIFGSQRSGDRRWQVFIGFADGKGDAVQLLDGRTPTSSVVDDLIAFHGTDPQGNQPGIYTVPSQGGTPKRVTTHESDLNPAFSPKNNQLVFTSSRSGNWDIWTVPVDGRAATQITSSPTNDGLPTWSPDGSQIAFVSDRGGSWGVYVISASGGEAKRVADWGGEHSDWLLERIAWGP